jgi:hypothetical protein
MVVVEVEVVIVIVVVEVVIVIVVVVVIVVVGSYGHPATGRGGTRGSRYVKAPDFLDVRHYESGRSSALRTGRLYPRRNPWLSRPQGTWFRRGEPRKKSPVTPPGIDPGTVRLVAQCSSSSNIIIIVINKIVL